MKAALMVLLGAGCMLAVLLAFQLGRRVGPAGGLRVSTDSGEREGSSFLRLSLEVATGELEAPQTSSRELDPTRRVSPRGPELEARAERDATKEDGIRIGSKDALVIQRKGPVSDLWFQPRQDRLAHLTPRADDRLTGELLEAWHSDDQPAFRGAQVLTEKGEFVRQGPWQAWHENGQVHELGDYAQDEEHGFWRWWYPNGNRMAEGEFEHGRRIGEWSFWFEDGGLQMRGNYFEGDGHGEWSYWFENGYMRAQGELWRGQQTGVWRAWNPDGTSNDGSSGTYSRGQKISD